MVAVVPSTLVAVALAVVVVLIVAVVATGSKEGGSASRGGRHASRRVMYRVLRASAFERGSLKAAGV